MSKKYVKTKYPGIWLNPVSKTYSARKTIDGKRHSKSFQMLKEAIRWRSTFNGVEKDNELKPSVVTHYNGTSFILFSQAWEKYLAHQKRKMGTPSFQKLKVMGRSFDSEIQSLEIREITNPEITKFLERMIPLSTPKRLSYDQELKRLRAFFNFIFGTIDPSFRSPITKYHFEMGTLVKKDLRKRKRKVLTQEELNLFLTELPPLYRTIALVQFTIGGRISEVIALNTKNVNFEEKTILVKDVAVICYHTKKVIEIKECTKNGEIRVAIFGDYVEKELKKLEPNDEGYFFHQNQALLTYRHVQCNYDAALKRIGIYEEISGSHIFRYTSASLVRNELTIDHTAALTGHKDIRMVQHYGKLDVTQKNKETSVVLSRILETTQDYPKS